MSDPTRLLVELSDRTVEILDRLERAGHARDVVVDRAVQAYAEILRLEERGSELLVREATGSLSRMKFR